MKGEARVSLYTDNENSAFKLQGKKNCKRSSILRNNKENTPMIKKNGTWPIYFRSGGVDKGS